MAGELRIRDSTQVRAKADELWRGEGETWQGFSTSAYRGMKGLRQGGRGGSQAAGGCLPPGGFIRPGFRQGLISEQ